MGNNTLGTAPCVNALRLCYNAGSGGQRCHCCSHTADLSVSRRQLYASSVVHTVVLY